MVKRVRALIFVLVGLIAPTCDGQEIHKRTTKLMGSRFDITVVADDSSTAHSYIDLAVQEIERIERLISSWDARSQTSEINRLAGQSPVVVDQELFDLIQRAMRLSTLTDGAFDISYASMDRIWQFDGSMTQMPSKEAVKTSVARVGYDNIILNPEEQSVYLTQPGMKIGFGAIGKGYAADKAKDLLIEKGAKAGIINASGDMNTWGRQPNGQAWNVAITNPMDKKKSYGLVPIEKGAVVTSGNYEKYVYLDGKRFSHIIDPRTGYPSSGILSVSVFAPKAELADALATSVFVMGIEVGLDLIDQIPQVECIIIDEHGHIHKTDKIQIQ